MNQPFADPAAPSSGIPWAELNGSLLLAKVTSLETDIDTQFGKSDAVRADVTVLDGPKAGEEFVDTLVFPKVLQSQLRARVGQTVLGRLGQGQGKPGQSPPWMLSAATPQDQQTGAAYLASKVAQPAPQQQAQPAAQGQPQPQGGPPAGQQWPQQPAAQPQPAAGQTVPF